MHDNYLIVLIGAPSIDAMHIAILTFDGYNELDSLIALGILNRVKQPGWRVSIASPATKVRSMNGVVIEAQASLQDAVAADAVIVGSGMQTREVIADAALMAQLKRLDPTRQLLGEKEPSMQFTTPEELGELAVFFCSPAGANVRGVAWNMDGGWVAQ